MKLNADLLTEQAGLLELQFLATAALVKDRQRTSLFRPCRINPINPCIVCLAKQHVLRKRYP